MSLSLSWMALASLLAHGTVSSDLNLTVFFWFFDWHMAKDSHLSTNLQLNILLRYCQMMQQSATVNLTQINEFHQKNDGLPGQQGSLRPSPGNLELRGSRWFLSSHGRKSCHNSCKFNFIRSQDRENIKLALHIVNTKKSLQVQQYFFPINRQMNAICYTKGTTMFFQWHLQQSEQKIVGLSMDLKTADSFQHFFSRSINLVTTGKYQGQGIRMIDRQPNYYEEDQSEHMSNYLLHIADLPTTVMANSCKLYSSNSQGKFQLSNKECIFLLKEEPKFNFFCYIISLGKKGSIFKGQFAEGSEVLSYFSLTSQLNYQISTSSNFLKFFDICKGRIRIVLFDGFGIAMNLKVLFAKLLWQASQRVRVDSAIQKQQVKYLQNLQKHNEMQIEYPQSPDYSVQEKTIKHLSFLRIKETKVEDSKDFKEIASIGLQDYKNPYGIFQAKTAKCSLIPKGPIIQIYVQDLQEKFKKADSLPEIKDSKGKSIVPSNILMLKQDQRAFLLNSNNSKGGYYFDLNKQKIIQQFNDISGQDIKHITHKSKNDDLSQQQTFYGITSKGVYLLDPRVSSCVGLQKNYKTQVGFCAIASNQDGNYAVGSQNGDIRLYKEVGQNAKNRYPGLGDPVLHLESSRDGEFLLATMKNYLLLIQANTQQMGDAFRQTIGIDSRIIPKKLRLKPDDFQRIKAQNPVFTKARFDQSRSSKQKMIIAGFGNYTVIWQVQKVLKGKIFDYKMFAVQQRLFESQFLFENNEKLIMASQKFVRLQGHRK